MNNNEMNALLYVLKECDKNLVDKDRKHNLSNSDKKVINRLIDKIFDNIRCENK